MGESLAGELICGCCEANEVFFVSFLIHIKPGNKPVDR